MSHVAIDSAWRILQGVRPALPRREKLGSELADANAAQARGYYLPDEDERLRVVYRQYLGARSTLWQMVRDLQPHLKGEDLRIFSLAFCAASMLMRSASYLMSWPKNGRWSGPSLTKQSHDTVSLAKPSPPSTGALAHQT